MYPAKKHIIPFKRHMFCAVVIVAVIAMGNVCADENFELGDPNGVRFVKYILKHKGARRHRLRKNNDAEELFIRSIEFLKEGEYEEAKSSLKEAIRSDVTYMESHFILAGLYEREGNVEGMIEEYRYYLKKTHMLRKWIEGELGIADKRFVFIKEKFDHYGIPLEETTSRDIDIKYWTIGGLFLLGVVVTVAMVIKIGF